MDACARLGTDYVDINGETPWVRSLIDKYHETCATNGTKIVPMCGFDSIPSDLGTFFTVQQLQKLYVPTESPCHSLRTTRDLLSPFPAGAVLVSLPPPTCFEPSSGSLPSPLAIPCPDVCSNALNAKVRRTCAARHVLRRCVCGLVGGHHKHGHNPGEDGLVGADERPFPAWWRPN